MILIILTILIILIILLGIQTAVRLYLLYEWGPRAHYRVDSASGGIEQKKDTS